VQEVPASGLADANGEFSASGPTARQRIIGGVQKEGYYRGAFESPLLALEGHRWGPWNPTVPVTLRKVVNPIPMYARNVATNLPVAGESAGFDLMEGDWVAPFGHGKIADMLFTVNRRVTSNRDYESLLTVGFSQPADGIQPWDINGPKYAGALKLPRLAPADGYVQPLRLSNNRFPGGSVASDAKEGRNYFFRVRTVLGQGGKVASALYGKSMKISSSRRFGRKPAA